MCRFLQEVNNMERRDTGYTVRKTEDYKRGSYSTTWFRDNSLSTYYDKKTDQQCIVPSRSLAEIRKEIIGV